MPLTPGTHLGPYEIVALLGAGGMGEVYRARDTRLGRDVAVKVLTSAFASDPDRMRRFEQEARAVAALNHPNVLSVFDTGSHDGAPYLVTELLQGESFRDLVKQGPLAGRKATEYARQIACGLAAAHEKHIVHRDLKPENLFLTTDGTVKILDFGLAKMEAMAPPASTPDAATATIAAVTSPGIIMGTNGYMAPEQVRGEAVDHRADIFSFGATMYEMLTGRRAFQGETGVETLSAILKHDPLEVEPERLHVAPALERAVRHCLEKKPADRFQSARDLMFALSEISDATTTRIETRPVAIPKRRRWLLMAAAAVLGAAVVAGASFWAARRTATAERAEFAIAVPGEVSHLALSTDGKWLAFVSPGESGGSPMVYVQRIGSAEARAIAGSEGASYPFWSPDGAWIAFFSNGKLRKAAVAGGAPQSIATVGLGPRGGTWNRKGVILFARDSVGPLWRVNADGSGAAQLTETSGKTSQSHRWPFFLPDGDHYLMFSGDFGPDDRTNLAYLNKLSSKAGVELMPVRSCVLYAAGRIYFADANGALAAAPLDIGAGKITGAPQMVAGKVARSPSTYYATMTVSESSTIVYGAASTTNHSQLTWFDETGKELGRAGPVAVLANPALAPDGKRMAYDSTDSKASNVDVWIFDLLRSVSSRFTFDPSEEAVPTWSRDGATIAYRALRNGRAMVHLRKANGLEAAKPLAVVGEGRGDTIPNSWVAGDREILCNVLTFTGNSNLVVLPVDGSNARPFLSGTYSQINGQISPDGKWVAYASNETGDWEIYVTTFPGAAGKWQVSRGGGTEPRWRRDGSAIYYLGPRQMLTETAVSAGDSFSTGEPRELFAIRARAPISSTDIFTYDVAPDGKRFLVNQYVKPDQAPPLSIVLRVSAPRP